jgi:outer membrane cobalamin receptor
VRRLIAAGIVALAAAPAAAQPQDSGGDDGAEWIQLDNGEWLRVDESEIIEVYAEREQKPFDRDTRLVLSGRDLAARGVTDLAEALEQIPELYVRQLGRGGIQVNIRGARKAAVKVLIDGVPVDEVFYGTYDVSSIPVTDIAQIRVSMSPASPIDGVGGPGGVIEIHTIDAAGPRLLAVRANASSLPSADLAATARSELGGGFSMRGSATASLGLRAFEVAGPDGMEEVDEDRSAYTAALRAEYRRDADTRIVFDAFTQERSMVVPPGEDGDEDIIAVDGESSTRFGAAADLARSGWRFQGRGYAQLLDRRSTRHGAPAMSEPGRPERLTGTRAGVGLLANKPLLGRLHLLGSATLDTESGELEAVGVTTEGQMTIAAAAAGAQLDLAPFRIRGSVGAAVPIDDGTSPWPEAKLAVSYRPVDALELEAVVARKGRLPTLRERFRPDVGNSDLDPEIANFVEVSSTLRPIERLELKSTAYVRDTDGMIRFDGDRASLINVDDLTLRGVDLSITATPHHLLRLGGAYSYTDSYSPTFGLDSLDFLPHHRIEGWIGVNAGPVKGRLRLRHLSEQIDQTTIIDARTIADASVFATITSALEASLRLDNLGGQRYVLRRGGLIAPGRVVMLSLHSTWR